MARDESDSPNTAGRRLASALRLAALALVVVGFTGWAIEGVPPSALESPYTITFLAGVGCAVAAIYLGIFLADADD